MSDEWSADGRSLGPISNPTNTYRCTILPLKESHRSLYISPFSSSSAVPHCLVIKEFNFASLLSFSAHYRHTISPTNITLYLRIWVPKHYQYTIAPKKIIHSLHFFFQIEISFWIGRNLPLFCSSLNTLLRTIVNAKLWTFSISNVFLMFQHEHYIQGVVFLLWKIRVRECIAQYSLYSILLESAHLK